MGVYCIYKRSINNETFEKFNQKLNEIDWNEVKSCEHSSESYEIFITKFLSIYDDFFPKKKIKVKSKDITAGIKKNHLNVSNGFMKSFLNVEVKEIKTNIKTISDCLKQ